MGNRFKEAVLDPGTFSVTWEVVPGRGANEAAQVEAIETARVAVEDPRIQAITITDCPGGNPAILAEQLGKEMLEIGIQPLVHFTCKDKNRNQMESQLYAMQRAGVKNLLIMTGDYVNEGYGGRPKPVFDVDPIHALGLVETMNKGLEYQMGPRTFTNEASDFFAGCAVSPFKSQESEQREQYFKLKKKVEAGAQFIITQVGYDIRKYHEVLQFVKDNNWNVPVIGNIYVLPLGTAKLMNRNGLAGCVVTDELVKVIEKEKESADKGKEARLIRAAKMYGFMKGLGMAGAHIGGHGIGYKEIDFIMTEGEKFAGKWQSFASEFDLPQKVGNKTGYYLYKRDPETGLNLPERREIKKEELEMRCPFIYHMSYFVHFMMFNRGKNLFNFMRWMYKKVDGTKAERPFHWIEHFFKTLLYDCKDCGDCAMPNTAYICPMSKCPKNQRNGACGGSRDGWCEVYPGKKKCIYVKAYNRLKVYEKIESLNEYSVGPCNWHLYQKSSWLNYFLGRDHDAKRLNIPYVPPKQKKK